MTFDEFKHDFEIFSKIDTPEKLSICEQQYKSYVKFLESQDFFEPMTRKTDGLDHLSIYEKNILSILNFNQINRNQILFLIQPSFEPEGLLSIEDANDSFDLNYFALERNYWYTYSENNSIATAKIIHSKGQLRRTIGTQILDVVEQSMKEARTVDPGRIVLDGIRYSLSKIIGDHRVDVCKHSPDGNSKSGRVIQLLRAVIELVEFNANENFEEKIEDLLVSISKSKR